MRRANMKKLRLDLRFVVYREGEYWFAHSLELDIVAEAKDTASALADALRLCALQLQFASDEGDLGSVFRPAPPEIWAMYAKAHDAPSLATAESWPESVSIDKVEVRELELCAI